MTLIDWITAGSLAHCFGDYSQQYVKSVADFMSANQSAGRYLLCMDDLSWDSVPSAGK